MPEASRSLDGEPKPKESSLPLTLLRFAVAFALLGYLVWSGNIQWSSLSRLFSMWWVTLAALGMVGLLVIASSWRFCILLPPRGLHITLPASTRLTLIGMFFNTVLPGAGGGDLVRFYYGAAGHKGRRTEIVTVMFIDRLCGMVAMIMWPLLAAPFFTSIWMDNTILTGLLMAGLLALFGMVSAFLVSWSSVAAEGGALHGWLLKVPMGSKLWTVVATIASYRSHRREIAYAVGISLISHSLAIGAALLLAATMNPAGFDFAMSILIPIGFMANTIPLTPGGLGVGEAAFDTLFGLAGLSGGAEVILGWRLLLLVAGLAGLGVYLSGRHEFVEEH